MSSPADARPDFQYQGRNFSIEPQESILEALLRQGENVQYSCRKGSCLTCICKLEAGEVEHSHPVDADVTASGHFLPCVAIPVSEDVRVAPPQLEELAMEAELVERIALAGDIHEVRLAPMRELNFRPGQQVRLIRADGTARQYSIASQCDGNYYIRLHVRHLADGLFSPWLCHQLQPGERLRLMGPTGDCHYDAARDGNKALLMMGTGTGAGMLLAIVEDALAQGHAGPIHFYHGVRKREELYLDAELRALAARHPQLRYISCTSADTPPEGGFAGRVTDALEKDGTDLDAFSVFLCGNPLMVEDARYLTVMMGAHRRNLHADPFEYSHPPAPRDVQKIARIEPQPEIWQWLEEGPKLTRILTEFYDRVYVDTRLAPYFHGLPKSFVIQKQYEFLANLFTGGKSGYFGLNPYNAHHWMVISNDMFDHREALFETVLRDFELPAPLLRRWMAIHELFRSDMVKSVPRGMISGGVEQPLKTHEVSRLEMDTVCDGCGEEIPAGHPVRYHHRVGTLHCAKCAGIDLASNP